LGAIDFVKVTAKNIFWTAASVVQRRQAQDEIITKGSSSITLMRAAISVW